MDNKENKDISNLELLESMNKGFSGIKKRFSGIEKRFSGIETSNQEILESIIRSFSRVEEKMATKEDLMKLDLKLTTEIQDFRLDFKSYKKDTGDDIKKIKKDAVDLDDTVMHHDKRIEKLENKIFA